MGQTSAPASGLRARDGPIPIATAVFHVVLRIVEDCLIAPRAMEFAVDVNPLGTVLAVLVGGALPGVVGALVAIPVRRERITARPD
ncbi:AI-2E family transporter [Streptomyces sp. NPDC007157]|uniref:AI-2E family transporter n=1 Tax=Streptomyces sp. NPDC007157 TaxID=3154681 RepID=UPI0033CBC487